MSPIASNGTSPAKQELILVSLILVSLILVAA